MRILYLCHRFPFPPKRGGKIRPFNMIKHLSAAGHEVTVASLARSSAEAQEGTGIAPYCRRYEIAQVRDPVQVARMVLRLPSPAPSSMGFFYSPALARRVRELLARERFDLIFVHCSSMAQYVAGVQHVPKILDFGDMDSQKWLEYARYKPFPLSAGYWLEGKKLERAEKRLARLFDLCTATTHAEWETLESYRSGVATDWFPNGVDSSYFAPTAEPYDPDTICFVGRMDYYPNQECMLDFCANVLPRIQARRPRTKLVIVGADPSPAVKRLEKLPGVTVTGSVPDVRPYLQSSALMVVPLNIARGTQNKILEAMACGVPVVTSAVAAGGVDAIASEHFFVANNIEEHVSAVLRILGNRSERERLASAGRSRMLSHHAWDRSMQRLDKIIERCLSASAQDKMPRQDAAPTAAEKRWPVMVLAHNEERHITACLDSIFAADPERKFEVFVMANGCTDRTEEIVRRYGEKRPEVNLVSIALGDKCNAWNVFVHETVPAHCPGRDVYFFMDGDARAVRGSFSVMARTLEESAHAHAASAVPASGRNAARDRREMLEEHGLVANLYALRGGFVGRLRRMAVRIPLKLEGDDGLLGALIKWNLAPDRQGFDHGRIIPCADAGFEFESMSPFRPSAWKSYWKRAVRYGRRRYEFQLLGSVLKSEGIAGLPTDITEFYNRVGSLSVRWDGLYTVPNMIALRQMRSHWKSNSP